MAVFDLGADRTLADPTGAHVAFLGKVLASGGSHADLKVVAFREYFHPEQVRALASCIEVKRPFGKTLFEAGVFVNPILSPAVPVGMELLRTSYMASHTDEQIDRVLAIYRDVGRQLGLIPQ